MVEGRTGRKGIPRNAFRKPAEIRTAKKNKGEEKRRALIERFKRKQQTNGGEVNG